MELKAFTKLAYKRWTSDEEQILKDMFASGREQQIPHKQLWDQIAEKLNRLPTEVQRKLIRMYRSDEDLQQYKQQDWSREKVLDQLKDLYLTNKPMNKNSLPEKLKFILLKNREWFASPDSALAEAILSVGYARNEDGSLDKDTPIETTEDALEYVRLGHKKRHVWNLDEVKNVLSALHEADYPITLPFLTNHHSIYKSALGVNRKLESFKDVVKKFIEDGSIKSYPDLVCTIAPEYIAYYNPDKSRLKLSTEEIRVKKFLDRYKISYIIPRLSDKIPTGLETFANFVPDFIILDAQGNPKAVVEVFGSIGDRENSGVNELYADKTQAKLNFYKSLTQVGFVEIYNNNGRCDLDDDNLFARFNSFIKVGTQEVADLQQLVASSIEKTTSNLEKYGCSIIYSKHNKNYTLLAKGMQDLKFDSLYDIPRLTPKNPTLKEIIQRLIEKQKTNKYPDVKFPGEQQKDYQPRTKPIEYDSNRWISTAPNEDGSGFVG